MPSAIATPIAQQKAANIATDGSAFLGYASIAASGTTTLTSTSYRLGYVASPSGGGTIVKLPTTDIKTGYRYRLEVSGATEANYVALQSSGANEVDRIGGDGFIEVMALRDAPTTAAHWRVMDVYEKSSMTTDGAGANTSTITLYLGRDLYHTSIQVTQGSVTASASTAIDTTTGIPSRYRSSSGVGSSWIVRNAGAKASAYIYVQTDGILTASLLAGGNYSGSAAIVQDNEQLYFRRV